MPRKTKYTASISVSNEPVLFCEVSIGGLFARADATTGMSMGGSDLWVGFDVYVKVSNDRAINTDSERGADLKVLGIDINGIDRPTRKIQKEAK